MDYHELKQMMLEYLKHEYLDNRGNFQFQAAESLIRRFACDNGYLSNGQTFSEEEWEHILDIANSFLTEGIMRWGSDIHNANPPFMGLTSYGRKILSTDEPNPHDPDGYLQRIYDKVPNIDKNTKMYLVESLNTFQKNCFMSSAVMLGVSAESVFNNTYDSLLDSTTSQKLKKSLERIRNSAKTKQRINLFRDAILVSLKEKIPRKFTDDFESKTDPIFNLIRQIRNDVGHPTGIKIDKMSQYVNLQLFVPYIITSYSLSDFFKNTKL